MIGICRSVAALYAREGCDIAIVNLEECDDGHITARATLRLSSPDKFRGPGEGISQEKGLTAHKQKALFL